MILDTTLSTPLFSSKEVIEYITIIVAFAIVITNLKHAVEKLKEGLKSLRETFEKELCQVKEDLNGKVDHIRSGKDTSAKLLIDTFKDYQIETKERENIINKRIDDVKNEQLQTSRETNAKLDGMLTTLTAVSMALSKIDGYMEAKNQK